MPVPHLVRADRKLRTPPPVSPGVRALGGGAPVAVSNNTPPPPAQLPNMPRPTDQNALHDERIAQGQGRLLPSAGGRMTEVAVRAMHS
jgi:hypothetical protein